MVSACDVENNTVLHVAVHTGSDQALETLLNPDAPHFDEVRALLDYHNMYGDTALMVAAAAPNDEGVQMLLKAGADLNAVDTYGNTALDLVMQYMDKSDRVTRQDWFGVCALLLDTGDAENPLDSDED